VRGDLERDEKTALGEGGAGIDETSASSKDGRDTLRDVCTSEGRAVRYWVWEDVKRGRHEGSEP
jgi:hypothetical protein